MNNVWLHLLLEALNFVGEVVDYASTAAGGRLVADDGARGAIADKYLRREVIGARL